ncbi:MAG: PHP domain-containing protein [Planctomycetota bacterium]
MQEGVDLHIHSNWSDGLVSPSRIARDAVKAGLKWICLADHNNINGVEVLCRRLQRSPVRVIRGVEMTAEDGMLGEIHILGYGIDTGSRLLRQALQDIMDRKWRQICRMVQGLNDSGMELTPEMVRREAGSGYVGRRALARLMMRQGYVKNIYQAFSRYLGEEGSVYVPVGGMRVERVIRLIHDAAGIAVLAHPTADMLDECIEDYVRWGLDGIEVYRPGTRGNNELYAEMIAEDLGLVTTGGSDWHGRGKDGRLGSFAVPHTQISDFLEALELQDQ